MDFLLKKKNILRLTKNILFALSVRHFKKDNSIIELIDTPTLLVFFLSTTNLFRNA